MKAKHDRGSGGGEGARDTGDNSKLWIAIIMIGIAVIVNGVSDVGYRGNRLKFETDRIEFESARDDFELDSIKRDNEMLKVINYWSKKINQHIDEGQCHGVEPVDSGFEDEIAEILKVKN